MADNVYCLGQYACWSALVNASVNNLWLYGRSSFVKGYVANVSHNVYCGGYIACQETSIDTVGMSVYGQ